MTWKVFRKHPSFKMWCRPVKTFLIRSSSISGQQFGHRSSIIPWIDSKFVTALTAVQKLMNLT